MRGERAAFHEWHRHSPYLDEAVQFVVSEVTLAGAPDTQRIRLAETSANFFGMLGTSVAPGRAFMADEDVPGRSAVAVIGHALWLQRFGGDPNIVNHDIRLNGEKYTVVGVMPAPFQFPLLYPPAR